jgi:glutamate synthase (ferredoxin)
VENGLRSRVVLETDGKLMSGRDVAIAALLGAEEYGFATAPLVTMGCMMMRVCSKDTCPVGIATQNEKLRCRFKGKPEHVVRFMTFIARQLRQIMAELGFTRLADMIGRTDCLRVRENLITDRAFKVDLRQILGDIPFPVSPDKDWYDFRLETTPDLSLLIPAFAEGLAKGAMAGRQPENVIRKTSGKTNGTDAFEAYLQEKKSALGKLACEKAGTRAIGHYETSLHVSSTDRAFGAILGSEVTKNFGNTLADDTFVVHACGGGGQSFGAFLPKGVTIRLTGDANDGFGKGLSGGKLIVVPDRESTFEADKNIIVGNVALFGATSGKAYFNGVAGERFGVRNSGATLVAEGCGDHGLEYMTGGRAVILGGTGKNFAAGMSGGIAYVLDMDHSLYRRMNKDMTMLQELTEDYDIAELRGILEDYVHETSSALGQKILSSYSEYLPYFKKIVPRDYQRMLTAISRHEEQGMPHDKAVLEAFREISAG